jgi:hypothetical protein
VPLLLPPVVVPSGVEKLMNPLVFGISANAPSVEVVTGIIDPTFIVALGDEVFSTKEN